MGDYPDPNLTPVDADDPDELDDLDDDFTDEELETLINDLEGAE